MSNAELAAMAKELAPRIMDDYPGAVTIANDLNWHTAGRLATADLDTLTTLVCIERGWMNLAA